MGKKQIYPGRLMPTEDAARWNSRYQDEAQAAFESPRSLLTEHAHIIPSKGLALDIAMGLGGNANFLLQRGMKVIGVDISSVAIRNAKSKMPKLMAAVADLPQFYIPPKTFDLILDLLFLQRDLWVPMTRG